MQKAITDYYSSLASEYDDNRFSNTYGKYLDYQEKLIISKYFPCNNTESVLDIACGTGRFLEFASHGIDISEEMLKVARSKFPKKHLVCGNAKSLPFAEKSFNGVICMHLVMHLNQTELIKILKEVKRVTQKNGLFVFDVLSEKRRVIKKSKSKTWHCSNSITKKNLLKIISGEWKLETYHGVAFLPIHRMPSSLRYRLLKVDNVICNSFVKEYSSYLTFVLRRI